MALSEDELKLQLDILASRTDQNANMTYKANTILNKGLNPEFFSGQNTKIVNAINLLASNINQIDELTTSVASKINDILLDTSNDENLAIWNNVKELMGEDTIIEGLQSILEGKKVDKILNINVADKGKVLAIDEDENGNAILKAIDNVLGEGSNVSTESLAYTNSKAPNVTNIKEALDYAIDKIANGNFDDGEWGGGTIIGQITWDMIDDKPEFIANKLELNEEQLVLKDGDVVLSTVPLTTNQDVEDIIDQL